MELIFFKDRKFVFLEQRGRARWRKPHGQRHGMIKKHSEFQEGV